MEYKIEAYKDSLTLGNKLMRLVWNISCFILFRPFAGPLFWRWRNTVLRMFGAKIGKNNKISNSAKIWAPWNLTTGRNVCIGPGAIIYSVDKIVVEDKVTISQNAFICTASHDISSIITPLVTKPIRIKSFSWICADAFIAPGITIGEGAIVGARAAVFKNVEEWDVVGGNPAKVLKKRVLKESE